MVKHTILTLFNIIVSLVVFIEVDLTTSEIRCPDPAQWHLRAKAFCNASFPSYVCLQDDNNDRIIETCEKRPNFQTPGYKFVVRGGYDGKPCERNKYQPFTFWTDGNSDCVFSKSKCEEGGQIYSDYGSTTNDVSCRCDHTKGYAYVTEPLNLFACQPSTEDCSCYFKRCKDNMVLADDYTCQTIDNTYNEANLQTIEKEWSKDNDNKEVPDISEEHPREDETFTLQTNYSRKQHLLLVILFVSILIFSLLSVIPILEEERQFNVDSHQPNCHTEIAHEKMTYQNNNRNIVKSLLDEINTRAIVTIISEYDGFRYSVVNTVTTELRNRYHYLIIYSSLKDVDRAISKTSKAIIVIEDIFENDTRNVQTLGRWHDLFNYIYLRSEEGVKLLLTCKPHVFQTYLFHKIRFLADTIFDLDLNTCWYDIDDLRLYLTCQEISALKFDHAKAKDDLFLILCKRYAWKKIRNEVKSVETFFSDYDRSIKEDLRLQLQRDDKSAIVALMLITINSNRLEINMLSLKNLKITNILLYLSALPEMGKPLSSNDIRDELEILSRSYVEKSEHYYSIYNERLRRIFMSFYVEHFLPLSYDLRHLR